VRGGADRTLAHTRACTTLGSLNLPSSAPVTKHLEQLVVHPDLDRARFASTSSVARAAAMPRRSS